MREERGPGTTEASAAPTAGASPTLSGVLREFEGARGNLTLVEIARRLGTERSALEGMIQLLVRKGRLRRARGAEDGCAACGLRLACGDERSGGSLGTCYELVRSDG